jgi:hypothetical protein
MPFDNGRAGTPATATTGALYAMRSATPVIIGNPAFTGQLCRTAMALSVILRFLVQHNPQML